MIKLLFLTEQLHYVQSYFTFTTGVAGRATVLTEEVELLFGVTADVAGGITAVFPLLAPLAPLAAPAVKDTVRIKLKRRFRSK